MQTETRTFSDIINGEKPVLIDFFAEWCGPCKMMPPILKELKDNNGDKLTILKIDVDRNAHLSQQYGIQGVPTLMLFKKGQVRWRQSGVIPAKQVQSAIQQFL